MNKIFIIAVVSIIMITFDACGGDGGGAFQTANGTQISISNCETYTTLKSGDLLAKESNGTQVKIVFESDGSKKICVVSGSAHLVRVN